MKVENPDLVAYLIILLSRESDQSAVTSSLKLKITGHLSTSRDGHLSR